MSERILIIGAGPTGLGAAHRLRELGHSNYHIYEQNPYVGGLAASFKDSAGFTWDIGGHVVFSHYPYFDGVFDAVMGDDFQLNDRESWVRTFNTWVPYPFQYNIRYLPREVCCECLIGLIDAQSRGDAESARNCAEFMLRIFGEGIYRHFMSPYNFKVWAHPLEMLGTQWLGERVAVIDIERSIRNVLLERDDFGWGPNNRFRYPRGGTGEFYRRLALSQEGHLSLNRHAVAVDPGQRTVRFADGEVVEFDSLISTIPVDKLLSMMPTVPERLRSAMGQLRHSGGHIVGVGLRQPCPSTRSWMYFPEGNCPFYRVTYLSNYSPDMTPDAAAHYSLLCETSCSDHKSVDGRTVVDDTIGGLVNAGLLRDEDRDDIVSVWHHEVEFSYPTPSIERDAALSRLLPYLDNQRIYSRGRFGMWKYEVANTDHSVMQGVEVVNRMLLGENEQTIGIRYSLEGQNGTQHVRPDVAGSGDPLKARLPNAA